MAEKKKALNNEIKAYKIELVSELGEILGEMTLDEAKTKAASLNLDLMEIGKKGDLTLVKMLDYGKFLYKRKKQDQKNKAKGKTPDLKTIRLTFKISEHDLEVRKNQVEDFAKKGHPLKISLVMKGRENQYEEIAREKLSKFLIMIEAFYKSEGRITRAGTSLNASLHPIK
ncbi:MAG: translation initiation factor IF-3 [Candidatus Gracilibacteria bacterium]|nr:translation initiation factor IF-3 [Candidatus Gracilibacteria bacterium]